MSSQDNSPASQVMAASERQAQAILQAQVRLRQAAEEQARKAREELERVAVALCPAEVDQLRQASPHGLGVLGMYELAELVITTVRKRGLAPAQTQQAMTLVADAPAQILPALFFPTTEPADQGTWFDLPGSTMPEATPIMAAPEPPLAGSVEMDTIRASDAPSAGELPPWVGQIGQVPKEPGIPYSAWPEWATQWKQQCKQQFDRYQDAILALGDTGVATRRDLIELISRKWGVVAGSGSTTRIYRHLREIGYMEIIAPQPDPTWKPGHLVRLTERGRDLYRLLRGREPTMSQTTELLNRHKSAEHAQLNLEVGRMLWEAGYEVDLFPPEMQLTPESGGGLFCPDLVAKTLTGQQLYVECERQTDKNDVDRAHKWDVYHTASSGCFYIATASDEDLKSVLREVSAWAKKTSRAVTLYATNLERGKGRLGETVWIERARIAT